MQKRRQPKQEIKRNIRKPLSEWEITNEKVQANYAASKGGLIALTKTVAKELASRNIRANAIAPGFIQTEMTAKLPENVKSEMLKYVPLAKFGTVQDVANLALFLASDNSSYITGQVIQVDGGMVM